MQSTTYPSSCIQALADSVKKIIGILQIEE